MMQWEDIEKHYGWKEILMKRNTGAVSIEATISLTAFIFFFMMLYDLLTVCITQAKISEAINNTAKEISQYSYIIGKTGLDKSLGDFQQSAQGNKEQTNETLKNIATMYSSMENIGSDIKNTATNTSSLDDALKKATGLVDSIKSNGAEAEAAAGNLKTTITDIAQDPKSFILGIGQLVASEGFEVFKSKLIVAPLATGMAKKHLMTSEGQSDEELETVIKNMRIVPGTKNGNTSYIDGLDFSDSVLFPYGSDEITIAVKYKIKVIPLLPVNLEYEVYQKASTKGWMHGDGKEVKLNNNNVSVENKSTVTYSKSNSIWNGTNSGEINKLIRNMGIKEYKANGYKSLSKSTYAHMYNSDTNTFVMFSSSNPLYNEVTLDVLKDEDTKQKIKEQIETLTAGIKGSLENLDTVEVKIIGNNGTEKKAYSSGKDKKYEFVLTVPEDEGIKEFYQEVIKSCNTRGVKVIINQSYGCALEKAENN